MNDFKMRSGTQSFFSAVEIDKNYHFVRDELMAMEMPDVRRGRLVAKNLFPAHGGIAHRGGPLLEAGNNAGDPASCGAFDAATSSAFCTLVEWQRIERMAIGNPNAPPVPVVWVERDTPNVGLLEFDAYMPNSDLVAGTWDGKAIARTRSLLAGCGVDTAAADVRAPDVRNDGATVAFALRRSAGEALQLWTVQIDGSNCKPLLAEAGVHDFDPAWSPDGEWVVYASTKRGGMSRRFNRPQSDIWRVKKDGSGAQEMTFLSNSEIGPQWMREGRVTMTTEKVDQRDPQGGFYQLSGRRLNWDLTDYHPLLGQRARSPVDPSGADPEVKDSIGAPQATEIREGLDGNFLLILSSLDSRMVGNIAVFNRSVGPFENGRKDAGYLASVTEVAGSFRSPFPLPDGRILAAQLAGGKFALVAVDPVAGAASAPLIASSRSQVEAVLAYAYPARGFYDNQRQLVFGGAADASDPTHATVHFLDAPMLATLLGANLRRGRHPDAFRAADSVTFLGADGSVLGSAKLAADGSARVRLPSATPAYIALTKGGSTLFQMSEEHQFGPGETISLGVSEKLFDHVCGGCHGSVSGKELDVGVAPDTLTGASQSLSAGSAPVQIGP
jgi:WD40 repeat protein